MNFFNKNKKINLKKIILLITSVFLILINFKINNIFSMKSEKDLKKENENTINNNNLKDDTDYQFFKKKVLDPAKEKNNNNLKEGLAYFLNLMGIDGFKKEAEDLIKNYLKENIKKLNDSSEKFFESFTSTNNNLKDDTDYQFYKKEVLDKFETKQYEIFKEKIIDFIISPDTTEDKIKYALNQLVDECVNHNEEIIDKLSETFFDWE